MDTISRLYESRQFSQCIKLLKKFNCTAPYDELTTQNNLLVAKFQNTCSREREEDDKKLDTIRSNFVILWSKILCVPSTHHNSKDLRQLMLSFCCNVLYSILHGSCCEDNIEMAVEIAFQAVERLSVHYGIPQIEDHICKAESDRLTSLAHKLLISKKMDQSECSLLLYCFVLLSLMEKLKSKELIKEIEFILMENFTYSCDSKALLHQTETNCFLLLPPLLNEETSQGPNYLIADLARVVLSVFYCNTSLWSKTLEMDNVEHPLLASFLHFSKLKAHHYEPNSSPIAKNTNLRKENNLDFAKILILSAKCALEKKHWMAIKFLSIAVSGELGRTKECCALAMSCTATQFKMLGEPEMETEAWKIAEDAFNLKNSASNSTFHTSPLGFLLKTLGMLTSPSFSQIQYQLARSLLENRRYREAAIVYQQLNWTVQNSEEMPSLSDAFKFRNPTSDVVAHEHILALLMSSQFDQALNLIEMADEDDFILLLLHAEISIHLNHLKKAIQLLSKSICKLNASELNFLLEGGNKEQLKSRMHCKLAMYLDKSGNTKDVLHQLRLAIQCAPNDPYLLDVHQQFRQKIQINSDLLPMRNITKVEYQISPDFTDNWALHYWFQTPEMIPFKK